ncbi:MAG: hypothetical protein HYZ28_13070 [Myxococcales bacterium]|nr:hypothetical protein [Myxococcales bacterium]
MKPFSALRLLGALSLAALGCSVNNGPVASRYVKSVPVTASQGATITVSAEESPELAGATLAIPPGALERDLRITLELGLEPVVAGVDQSVGPVAVWGPAGTKFAQEAEMTLPFALAAEDLALDLFVQVQEEDGTRSEIANDRLTIDEQGKLLRFKVSGFTSYQSGSHGCSGNHHCSSTKVCHNGKCRPASCTPSAEVCDGVDNDCDGAVDEGCNSACSAGSACPPGHTCVNGACQPCTTSNCGPYDAGTPIVCGNTTCASGTTCCNASCGVCAPAGGSCTQQVCCSSAYPCPSGQACVNGACQPSCTPSAEVCDGVDNDCDGQVDEGCTMQCGPGTACPAGHVCLNGQCTPCSSGGYCPTDGGSNTTDGGSSATCGGSAACATGQVCLNGKCHYSCSAGSACPNGQQCYQGICY